MTPRKSLLELEPETVEILRGLQAAEADLARAATAATEWLDPASLAGTFRLLANQHRGQTASLRQLLRLNDRDQDGDAEAAATRDVRDAVERRSEADVLAAAARGEGALASRYERALHRLAGSPAEEVLARHREHAVEARTRLRRLWEDRNTAP